MMAAVILCVEDEDDLRADLCAELEASGYIVHDAADGVEALERFAEVRPDLVVCDIHMPRLDGHTVLECVRASGDDVGRTVPFIFLTALGDRDNQVRGRRSGADDYLLKPIDYDVLLAVVENRLSRAESVRVRDLERQIETLKASAAATSLSGRDPDLAAFVAAALPKALEDGALCLHLQPKVALSSGRVVGAEALARWTDAERGPIPPSQFVPVAEHLGLMEAVSTQVMRMAVSHAATLHRRGLDLPVSFNLSGKDLRPDLPEQLRVLMDAAALPPHMIQAEITESAAIADPTAARKVVRDLHLLGVATAIDDFGTGYASLAYVRDFKAQVLKIDQTFVHPLSRGAIEHHIVENILALCRALEIRVVAEGVETREQAALLREMGCDYVQGWLFSAALPLDDFIAFTLSRLEDDSQDDDASRRDGLP